METGMKRLVILGLVALGVVTLSGAAMAYDQSHRHQGRAEVRRGLREATEGSTRALRETRRATSRASANARNATRHAYREARSAIRDSFRKTDRALRDAFRSW
jgi:hypothetical protein